MSLGTIPPNGISKIAGPSGGLVPTQLPAPIGPTENKPLLTPQEALRTIVLGQKVDPNQVQEKKTFAQRLKGRAIDLAATGINMALTSAAAFVTKKQVNWALTASSRFAYRHSFAGLDNIPDNEPALFAANHVSSIDGWIVAGMTDQHIHFVMKYLYYYLAPSLFDKVGAIPIAKRKENEAVLEYGLARIAEVFKKNGKALIFPEGKLNREGEDTIGEIKRGVVRMAKDNKVDVYPVVHEGMWYNGFSLRRKVEKGEKSDQDVERKDGRKQVTSLETLWLALNPLYHRLFPRVTVHVDPPIPYDKVTTDLVAERLLAMQLAIPNHVPLKVRRFKWYGKVFDTVFPKH